MATPFLTFTEEQTLTIEFKFNTWEKLRYVAENKPPVLFKGYMHTESEDHGGGFVSHIATIDPDVAFITGDNKVEYGTAIKKTSHFMMYLLAGGSAANLYIKDYTAEMDVEEGTITLRFTELFQKDSH
mgnify:CR=1 FL=1|jgi:hypothetical protein